MLDAGRGTRPEMWCSTPAWALRAGRSRTRRGFCTREAATQQALGWIERVRGSDWPEDLTYDLEGKFLHATAAGNVGGVGALGADVSSGWNAATLISPLVDPRLARGRAEPDQHPGGGELHLDPDRALPTRLHRPELRARGHDRRDRRAGVLVRQPDDGASLTTAAPRRQPRRWRGWPPTYGPCGPASPPPSSSRCSGGRPHGRSRLWKWARSSTPTPPCSPPTRATPPGRCAARSSTSPTARASRGRDRAFDERDLDLFITRLEAPAASPIDYGRYDLNGDGGTGITDAAALGGSERVDLDLDGAYGLATLDVEGLPLRFDEKVSSDLRILCHAAYSPVYDGTDESARRERLGLARCLDVCLEGLFPATVEPGVNNLLSVRAFDPELSDSRPHPGARPGRRPHRAGPSPAAPSTISSGPPTPTASSRRTPACSPVSPS